MRNLTEHEIRIGKKIRDKVIKAQLELQNVAEVWNDFITLLTNGDPNLEIDLDGEVLKQKQG